MYHEAKKYEKKVKEILVDYRKRAERRQSFYQKIKTDPTQFLQIHGRKCKIHIDTSSGMQDVGTMMKWNNEVMIDRFDGRAHLDFIPQTTTKTEKDSDPEMCMEERQLNYERFRILILNEFLCFKEQDFLTQLDELHEINTQNDLRAKKKRQNNKSGISIGYTYDTEEYSSQTFSQSIATVETKSTNSRYDELAKDSSDSDMDFDLPIDINKVSTSDANELNGTGRRYGMLSNDFFSFITNDIDELQALKEAQKEETGKINRTGRRERRERREKKMRPISSSIPSYAKTDSDQIDPDKQEEESSDSNTDIPENITYITSFGNEEPKTENSTRSHRPQGRPLYSEKLKENLEKFKSANKRRKASRRYSTSSSSSSSGRRIKPHTSQHTNTKDRNPQNSQNIDVPVKRYYGRNRNSSDSSQLSYDSSSNHQEESSKSNDNIQNNSQSRGGKSSTNVKAIFESAGETKVNQKERLKRKMQILLNKQYKEDKKLETLKKLQQIEEQKEREVEMKELALKLRKRQRELRHQYSSSEHEEPRQPKSRESSKTKHRKRSRSPSSSSKSSKSSRSSFSRRRGKNSRYRRKVSPEAATSYSNKYDRYDRRRYNSRDRSSPDRYRKGRSRFRSRSFDRDLSRSRKRF